MGYQKPHARVVLGGLVFAIFTAPLTWSQIDTVGNTVPRDPGVRGGAPGAGRALPGLTPGQQKAFEDGKDAFDEANFVTNPLPDGDSGLGPRFNSDSCGSCHAAPAAGGTSPSVNPQTAVATKMGARNRIPLFLRQDGPVREVRFKLKPNGSPDGGVHNLFVISGRTDAPGCNIQQEDFSNTSNLAFRIPTPAFGLGLVEAISDNALRRNLASDRDIKASLGISGRLNVNDSDGTVTRFGHKAQNKSLHIFAGEAYNVEQGVSNHLFPQERDETPGCQFNSTPEDANDFDSGETDDLPLFAAFMRFLAPPQRTPTTASIDDGFDAFRDVGCNWCHTPSLQTGRSTVAALTDKPVPLFSDLALHNMGPGLADDIGQGRADGDEFRTAPLWGLGQRIFFLHDGRTKDLMEAIRAHSSSGNRRYDASEANAVIDRFNRLSPARQQHLLNFLRSL
ncbi:MAG: di-heme oxidoredictase family protein [Bryobacteraceae bacterium]